MSQRDLNTTRQLGGAIGLAATAAVAAAVHPHSAGHHALVYALTSGYDRALGVCAGVLVVGALLALFFPAQPREPQAPVPPADPSWALKDRGEAQMALGPQPALELVPARDAG
ncbi:MAG TPA: hypothetical protein VME20_01175 [Acidimicrobiales bacterium]|nr:hypothetical protein [Acidimicrobiales bacterium]